MGSGQSDDNYLIALAQRRAFETYLRFGRTPGHHADTAQQKAIDPTKAIPRTAPPRATSFYVWRTAGDDRVRHSHAARERQVFSWAEPPLGGHPGTEPKCRCWPEPYYGDPSISEELQPLEHGYHADTSNYWTSIETLARPDGSVAHSIAIARDGIQIKSRFTGTLIQRIVTLASGAQIRIDTSSGVQSVYIGDDRRPLFQSAWTIAGPKVIRAQQRVAFLGDPTTLFDTDFTYDSTYRVRDPDIPIIDPNAFILIGPDAGGLGLVMLALLALFAAQQAVPASQGLSESDKPVAVVKTWVVDGYKRAVPILVGSLTEEQLRQDCRFLPDVQKWTNDAATAFSEQKPVLSASAWGSLVHGVVKRTIDALKKSFPLQYQNLKAELSLSDDPQAYVPYGQKNSTRLDVVEDRTRDMGAVCDYDIKTGREGLTPRRLREIANRMAEKYPGAIVYIIEVRPAP